jgi:hypothetical protein
MQSLFHDALLERRYAIADSRRQRPVDRPVTRSPVTDGSSVRVVATVRARFTRLGNAAEQRGFSRKRHARSD